MHWFYLGVAVVSEITVAISAGNAKGFTRPAWVAATLVSGGIATYFLSLARVSTGASSPASPPSSLGSSVSNSVARLSHDQRHRP